jgi:hypothetical protein
MQAYPDLTIEVKPGKQTHISLGDFTASNPPKGFSYEVTPKHETDAVVVQITRLGAEFDKYELVLHVANYGDKTVNVDVAELVVRAPGGVERHDQEDAAAPA